jgi:hypothetical protein
MFHSIDDTSCLFEDYKLSPEELNSCRKRLLAIDPYLCIAEEEQSENEDWADVFYFVGDEKRIICIVPNWYEVNVPQVFVLSDEHDYEMDDKSLFDFLTYIYEKKPGLKLSNKQFTLDDETHSHTGLIYYVACYLTAVPKESEIYNSYDNYHSGVSVMPEPPQIDVDEAIRLIQVVLTTVYNYPKPYKLNSSDMKDLALFMDI